MLSSTPLRGAVRQCWSRQRRTFSASNFQQVELSYQRIEPPSSNGQPSGQPIIFMHGLFGSKRNNRSISKALARDLNRDIYIVDLRNHGDTGHAQEHTYDSLAEDVAGFVRQHRLGKTVLIGHSMGAKTAMTLALRSPETIAGLIPGMKEIEAAGVTKQSEADEILAKYESALPIRQFLLTNLIRDPESANHALKFRVPLDILGSALDDMAFFPFSDGVTYNGPTLFIRGLHSTYVSDKTVPAIKKFFPNAQIADIESGHWVISEKPEEFRQAVLSFFKENEVE
ncbi:putative proline iminopeptidase [Talaromyces proteolyticus]|uniref:Proline iminopeptidase n=1 Tax=Talaromyces proteolyticus TaxID=1131652 RepID=A0AAD4KLU7_9EURO|nr:putative proline iminopeptidase [Talaromyces proteolyticus]KAH8691140.1 putative proline iminopeptidase [Talaromyces proteolyticus]